MEKIASFTVNHIDLLRGIYVSRKDLVGNGMVTTFDLRWKVPNKEEVMGTGEMHAIEHLAATFLRNHPVEKDNIIYFGPMGCRTGFYLLMKGDLESKDIVGLIKEMLEFVSNFEGEIPGATPRDCGNCADMNLSLARNEAKKYLVEVIENIGFDNLNYPK
ncbi:MAG: S-ribosylhomocysteine lyase [Fusobacteriaceae bacterium]|jgi:S-ribosylhomocysteine lyase|nr:S-ribosylhomocysteine lyase [Fusobacteriaceae bacterium]